MAFIDFTNGEVLTADQMDTVMRQSVMKFADASARDTALSAVLAEGMMCYLDSTDEVLKYDGSSWIDISGDITGVTAGTALTGGGTSGNVTLDVDTAAVGTAIGIDTKQDDVITTQGDLVIGDGSGDASRISIGAADTVLTSNGTTATWAAAGGGGLALNSPLNFQIINSTQSVTLSTDHLALCIGGGGAGAGINNKSRVSGSGGGSGFISAGTVTAGTYTATIGAGATGGNTDGGNGGTTSISGISAAGGNGGTEAVDFDNPGNGGNGGSGGVGGVGGDADQSVTNDGVSGFDGENATNPTTGRAQGTSGTSSGESIILEAFVFDYLLDVATAGKTGSTGTTSDAAATQVYSGGAGGNIAFAPHAGANATGAGSGGSGATGNRESNTTQAGGDGANGQIILVEL